MISIDMECSNGHIFEGWFDSLDSFEDQNANNLVTCPFCDDLTVRRVISPVAVKRSTPSERDIMRPIDYQQLAQEVVDHIRNNSEDVGQKFAAEALKMHYGVIEKKNIRGFATAEEENVLKDEGIGFFKIPVPKEDDDKN
jgi:hypothetical protein